MYRALIFGLTTKCRDEGQDKDTLKTKQIPTDKLFPLDRGCCFAAADAVITHLMRQEKCVTLRLRIDCVRDLYPLLMPEKGNEVCLLYSSSCTYAFKSVLFAVYPPPFPRHAFIIHAREWIEKKEIQIHFTFEQWVAKKRRFTPVKTFFGAINPSRKMASAKICLCVKRQCWRSRH